METSIPNFLCPKFNLFKSYYVVWKRFCYDCIFDTCSEFKSYYVVWKRIRWMC